MVLAVEREATAYIADTMLLSDLEGREYEDTAAISKRANQLTISRNHQ
ncbi:MAG: hypothetical protein ACOC8O_02525 [Natronomonas sp.]